MRKPITKNLSDLSAKIEGCTSLMEAMEEYLPGGNTNKNDRVFIGLFYVLFSQLEQIMEDTAKLEEQAAIEIRTRAVVGSDRGRE